MGEAVCRRQLSQWQWADHKGWPEKAKVTLPQRQCPVVVMMPFPPPNWLACAV